MAKPKTIEEIKIYKELVEKYKDNKKIIEVIQEKYNDQSDEESWSLAKATLDWIEG